MNARFVLVAIVEFALFSAAAEAQIVTFDKKTFAEGPARIQPQGRWSVAPKSGIWRIEFDYGTLDKGAFTHDPTIGGGGVFELPTEGGDGKWEAFAPESLKKPLAKYGAVRARLQKKDAKGNWVDQGSPAYGSPPRKSES